MNLLGQAYTARSGAEDFQTCVNWIPEAGGTYSKYKGVFYPTPGLTEFAQLSGEVVRAMTEFDNVIYAVCDRKFYTVTADGTATLKATLNAIEPIYPPCIVSNGTQICIVDNGYGYVYDILAGSFTEITDPNFTAAAPYFMTFQDGYGIYNQPGTAIWWLTNINNFLITNDLDFASASTTNEDIQALVSCRQQVYIFTKVGTEIWYNTGNADFPFERKNTSYITQGCAAPFSILSLDNTIYYLTSSEQGQGYVVKVEGDSQPVVVSTTAINYMINQFDRIDDAIAFGYQDNGHLFYVITFPDADKTLVYDLAQDAWHERASWRRQDPQGSYINGRFKGNCYSFLAGQQIVGDYSNGKLYIQDSNVYTEDDELIHRERTTAHLWNDLKRLTLRSITLDFQMGVGENSGVYEEPQVSLYLSRDGGYTYGNAYIASLGAPGQYNNRVKFNRLGMSRDFVGRISVAAPVNVVLLGASAEIETCDS